jgi:3-isopropylmalate/(R)-2-methylmalate dehydratase large subunit
MTITEKILAAHAGLDEVEPGQLINCRLDLVLANDVTAPIAIREFRRIGVDGVWDTDKIALVPDHYTPNKDIKSAEQAKVMRDFVREQGISHYYEIGCMGVEHALLPEQGVVGAGDLIIGADSHTCTYGALGVFATGVGSTDAAVGMATGEAWFKVPSSLKFNVTGELGPWVSAKDIILHIIGMIGVDGALYQSMEFTGSTVEALDMDGRMTICNMAIEAGGKSGIIAVDDTTRAYMEGRTERPWTEYFSDGDAEYAAVYEIDAAEIKPTVAFPHLPSNTRLAEDSRDIWVDQVVIGSCTNGRLEDLRIAAGILKGHKVHERVRLIVIPATQQIYRDAMHEGLFDIFLDAGAAVSTPTCGPCLGGHMGILAAGERAVATTNRNFVGRMGDPTSEVYLSSPAVAAATAVLGHIGLPDDLG